MTASHPLISVIVCTRNRPAGLRRAVASVLRQDEAEFEVVVVDDGSNPPGELLDDPEDRVRVIPTAQRGVGAARQEGLAAARGEYVAYCDDDDEWTSHHLRILRTALMVHPEAALVYGEAVWVPHEPVVPAVPLSRRDTLLATLRGIGASTVMHHPRAALRAGGFDPSLDAYEDLDLWFRLQETAALHHVPVVVAIRHWTPECVSGTDHRPTWDRVYHFVQFSRGRAKPSASGVGGDRPGSDGAEPFDPAPWQPGRKELTWQAFINAENSYGIVARELMLAVERRGVSLTLGPRRGPVPAGFERFNGERRRNRLGFIYDSRTSPSALRCERVVQYTMRESTLVPPPQVVEINRAVSLLYVPCRHNVESFRACGVDIPIKVLPHGVDPARLHLIDRPPRDRFTFGTFGDLGWRKGIDVLVRAFWEEFRPNEPVRLLLQNSWADTDAWVFPEDPRIELLNRFVARAEVPTLLREMDAFVLPSRGEGFGLRGLEAMATGLPVIATNWSGPADYLDPADSLPLSYRLVDANAVPIGGDRLFGNWAEPDETHLRSLLRWVYERRPEAAAMGQRAAARVAARFTWDQIARQLCADLDEVAAGVNPS